jgi:3-hydroxyisobutyrate dehydrogenase-like beta-hydroxyacid dehydrogenase
MEPGTVAMVMAMRVGWIGIGKMGLPMASRLLRAGHAVAGFDRNADAVAALASAGGHAAASMREACAGAAVVFSSLPDDAALREAATGAQGVLASMRAGDVFVDTSTVSPGVSVEVARAAHAAGVEYVRAAVSGNPVVAQAGKLTVFMSGPQAACDRVAPLLGCFGARVSRVGDAEQARTMKLVLNLMIAVSAGMMAEALVLGEKGGLDWTQMLDVIGQSAVGSPMVNYKVPPLKARDYTSTFSCSQMVKDLDLILGACAQYGVPAPLAAQMRQIYEVLVATGAGGDDYIATVRLAERLAGLGATTGMDRGTGSGGS